MNESRREGKKAKKKLRWLRNEKRRLLLKGVGLGIVVFCCMNMYHLLKVLGVVRALSVG